MDPDACVIQLEQNWQDVKNGDKARNGLVEQMFSKWKEAVEKIKNLECDIGKLQFHENAYETERTARIQENKKLEVQVKNLAERLNVAPFVMVFVDGDNTLFLDQFVQAGMDGGHQAAQLLHSSLKAHLKESVDLQPHWKVIVRIFANMFGLAGACKRAGIVSNAGTIREFFVGFNRELPFCDYVDVGYDKEAADNKIKEHLTTFMENEGCKHVMLAGSADRGYLSGLRKFDSQSMEKLTLVESVPFPPDFRNFAARVKTKRFPEVFREEKLNTDVYANVQDTPQKSVTQGTYAIVTGSGKQSQKPQSPVLPSAGVTAGSEIASTASKEPRKIKYNRFGQRIDDKLPEYDFALVPRVSAMKLCSRFYLSQCKYPQCIFDHTAHLSQAQKRALVRVARNGVCPRGTACNDRDCVAGHQCFSGSCEGGPSCYFPQVMHKVEKTPVEVV